MNRYGRVGEIFLSLLVVAPTEEIRDHLIEFQYGVFEDQKEEEATGEESEVVKAILACKNLAVAKRLAIRNIVDELNLARNPEDKISPRIVGWTTSRLGFRKARMPDSKGNRAIRLDTELLHRLMKMYDITDPNTPQTASETSERQNLGPLGTYTSDVPDHLTDKAGYKPLTPVEKIGTPSPNPPQELTETKKETQLS
jgi:hypothetical protein